MPTAQPLVQTTRKHQRPALTISDPVIIIQMLVELASRASLHDSNRLGVAMKKFHTFCDVWRRNAFQRRLQFFTPLYYGW